MCRFESDRRYAFGNQWMRESPDEGEVWGWQVFVDFSVMNTEIVVQFSSV